MVEAKKAQINNFDFVYEFKTKFVMVFKYWLFTRLSYLLLE